MKRISSIVLLILAFLTALMPTAVPGAEPPATAAFVFQNNDVIAIVGNGLADRMQHDGWMETLLQSELPELQLHFRNMAVSGDRPSSFPRSRGAMPVAEYLQHVKASVVFAFFGYNESYAGVDKADEYRQDLLSFVQMVHDAVEYGEEPPRIVLVDVDAHMKRGDGVSREGSGRDIR